ncbi:MAG TPA: protease complex subunit PrcB family protein, partial [Fibrobacteria bacterium]|nr:protease complex subunit PrcB family protein [Fibrobacteria bacterium]
PQLFWIRTEEGFAKYGYERRNPPSGAAKPDSTAPGELDFARHDVILLTMGVQGTTGYNISLQSIRKSGRDVRFQLKTKSPTGPVGEALTHPGVLVQVEKLPRDSRLVMEMNGKESSFDLRVLE